MASCIGNDSPGFGAFELHPLVLSLSKGVGGVHNLQMSANTALFLHYSVFSDILST